MIYKKYYQNQNQKILVLVSNKMRMNFGRVADILVWQCFRAASEETAR